MRRIVLVPVTQQVPDGSWRAVYPELDSVGVGDTSDRAGRDLGESHRYRLGTEPEYRERFTALMADPPKSWITDELTQEQYDDRMRRLMAGDELDLPTTSAARENSPGA